MGEAGRGLQAQPTKVRPLMANPTKRTPETEALLLASLSDGVTTTEAAKRAGIAFCTLWRWQHDDPPFGDATEAARTHGALAWVRHLDSLLDAKRRQRQEAHIRAECVVSRLRAGDASLLAGLSGERAELARLIAGTHRVEYVGGRRYVWRTPRNECPRCGARTRRGTPCQARPMPGKRRCRHHGGCSTGPKTAEGRARIAESNRRRRLAPSGRAASEEKTPRRGDEVR